MDQQNPFKWRHYEADIILLCVRWYLRYSLSYRDLEEMMRERGLHVDHTTIYRWVQRYAPELEQRCKPHLKATNDSWRVDETYVKVKKVWMYLYRAVDSQGNTLEGSVAKIFKLIKKECTLQSNKGKTGKKCTRFLEKNLFLQQLHAHF